ncbi:ORF2b [Kibale red-tailed guenon virus 1]|uniref:ORF2b n=1 Tax=Kibale red-tailed guenon virus 1 TaxID=1965065 RepID=L0CRR1_9NIDO|nr:ORF2b [Kibale red-tailed guenon virus 1]AGA19104.1 ORF2b [Kibale red-tailed guenon virus 1]
MAPWWLLCLLTTCLSFCHSVCANNTTNNSSDPAPTSFCFFLPVANLTFNITFSALVCKPEYVNLTEEVIYIPNQRATVDNHMGCAILGAQAGSYWSYPKVSETARYYNASVYANIPLQQSHEHVSYMLTALTAFYPEVFGIQSGTNHSRSINTTTLSNGTRICISGAPPLNSTELPTFTFAVQSDLYLAELFRPFILSILILAMARL